MTHPFDWIVLFPSDPAPEEPGRISPPRITRTTRTGSNDCWPDFAARRVLKTGENGPVKILEWDFLHAHVAALLLIIILNVVMCRILTILAVFKGQVQATKRVYFDCLKLTELKWTVLTLSTTFCVFKSI